MSQREQSTMERSLRRSTGVITIPTSMINRRDMVGITVFDTFIDYLKYINDKDLWNELFKFPTPGTNRMFIKLASWKENAILRIQRYNMTNSIQLKEDIVKLFYNKIIRFMKLHESLNNLLKDDINQTTRDRLQFISKFMYDFVRRSSNKNLLFTVMPNRSKQFIDLLFDGVFSNNKHLEFIEEEMMFDTLITNSIHNQEDDDHPPPLSSSSSSPSSSDTSDVDDHYHEERQKRQKTTIESNNNPDDNIIPFDMNTFVPPPPQSIDFLESIKIPSVFDHIQIKREKIKEAINISTKIQDLLQDIFGKNPLSFVNFIAKLNYKNFTFCLTLIDQAIIGLNYHMASTITIALINSMKEDLINIKTTEKIFFDDSCRKQYGDLMQQMFNIPEFIL